MSGFCGRLQVQQPPQTAHHIPTYSLAHIEILLCSSSPRVLTLDEQGLFALGYYHQRAHDRAQARDTAQRHTKDAQEKEE